MHSVLIAEDNPGLSKVLGFKFKAAGFQVVHAPDGAAAWDAFQSQPTSAVVSDQEMPRMTGVELFRRIRAGHPSVPLFLVTGRQLELATTGIENELSLNGMFAKPFSPAGIVSEVQRAIDAADQSAGSDSTPNDPAVTTR